MTLNINKAVHNIKVIFESFRCALCDKTGGDQSRYSCGHFVCSECANETIHCLNCLTPPSLPAEPVQDVPRSSLVKNVSILFETFQDAFHIDVYKYQRLSDQLKLEKELFPQCIQAPQTYSNKRKSKFYTKKDITLSQEPLSQEYPGEKIDIKMNSKNYVQDWLDNHQKDLVQHQRKPFTDIPVNSTINKKLTKQNVKEINYQNHILSKKKKLSRKLTQLVQSDAIKVNKEYKRKKIKDESGIDTIDDLIVIDDSQEDICKTESEIDKDREACLAVLAHDRKENKLSNQVLNWLSSEKIIKVPFYKRSPLIETCQLCYKVVFNLESKELISIDVKSKLFSTNVTVSHVPKRRMVSKYVQTDLIEEAVQTIENIDVKSMDVAKEDVVCHSKGLVVISESSSESDDGIGKTLVVTADIHSSSDFGRGVLREISQNQTRNLTPLKRARTPASSDSSDKENRDPNSVKKPRDGKKRKKK